MGKNSTEQEVLIGYRSAAINEKGITVGTTPYPVWTNEKGRQCALASLFVVGGVDGGTFTITVDGVSTAIPLKTGFPLHLPWQQFTEVFISKTLETSPSGGISFTASANVTVAYRLRIVG